MNIISLGSNCETSMMISNHALAIIPNSILYTHLFAWSNITIKGVNHFFQNTNLLNFDNFRYVYRFFDNCVNNISKKLYYDLNECIQDAQNHQNISSIHIDIDYTFEEIYVWSHGIKIPFQDFNLTIIENCLSDLKNKTNHMIEKTLRIMNDNNVKVFCIKCLKEEYSIQDIIELNSLILKCSSNNYMSFIVEKDENIILDELKLTKTYILNVPKLTAHNEAIYSSRYNTDVYYIELFENTLKMLNI